MKLQKNRISRFVLYSAILVCLQTAVALAAAEGTFQRTLKVSGPVNLDIETGSGNIQVKTGSSAQVEITGHIRASNWFGGGSGDSEEKVKRIQANPPIQQSGNDIRLGHIDDPSLRRNISISYEVVVPAETRLNSHTGSGNQTVEGVRGPIEIQTGSGNLNVSNIGNTVRAESGSGDIEAEKINGSMRAKSGSGTIRAREVAGGLEAESGSGNITLVQTAAGSVRVETGSGSVDLRGTQGSLQATTGSGDIHAEGDPKGTWKLHTGSGSVRLRVPSDASFDLYAHTGSGGINVGAPITVQGALGKREIRGKVRGGGVPVEVETGSGGIDIN
jgi:DUF4097 and DUF4098 domain-containing protein YvlB